MAMNYIQAVQHDFIRTCSNSGLSLALYDFLCTLPDEIHLVWGMKWTIGKVFYYATTYLVFIAGFLLLVTPDIIQGHCNEILSAGVWLTYIAAYISEGEAPNRNL
ncbi:hypothetical protein M422DRAFT_54125 [Sphaerobolus stellatus SS14]|uniref:DUF6533 domain-containing protein n=1 Tax=Sphaerobolus stellatus (strain SS14) TaxID=990650 RepID=A0A0C9TJ00_SPHS4|nr:hypothetical protein M422DRAFT_54125 [Sphaerobolus stellatus SS14]